MENQFDLVLYHCTAFLPESYSYSVIGIKSGKIGFIGNEFPVEGYSYAMDLQGKYVLPGLIDEHVHFRVPGLDHKEDYLCGSAAAIAGGVTTILDMPNTKPEISTVERLVEKDQIIEGQSYVNYGHHFLLTKHNFEEIEKLSPEEVASVKVFMAGHETAAHTVFDYDYLLRVAKVLSRKKIIMTVHAEYEPYIRRDGDPSLENYETNRGRAAAVKAVEMMISIAQQTNCRIHIVHTSTEDEMRLILQAKQQGIPITCEVIPPHLFFTNEDLIEKGPFFKLSPPLRTAQDIDYLWNKLISREMDTVGSDHAPHTIAEKEGSNPPAGMPGVQEMISVIFSGLLNRGLSKEESASLISTCLAKSPAEIFSIRNKGMIGLGYDADLVVFNPDSTFCMSTDRVKSKCKWSIYDSLTLTGEVEKVFIQGKLAFSNHDSMAERYGQKVHFVRRAEGECE